MKRLALPSLLLAASLSARAQDIIQVNGEKITQTEYYRRMEFLPGLGRPFGNDFVEILPAIATIDALVTERLVLQLATTRKVAPTDLEIDNEIAYRLKKEPKSLENWKALGRTDAEFKQKVRVELAQFRLLTEGVTVTDAEIQDLYEVSKANRYTLPRQYTIKVITVADQATASKVDAELKLGKTFEAMVVAYSIDEQSRLRGGDYGTIAETLMSEKLKAVISKIPKGQASGWLKGEKETLTKFKVTDILAGSVIPLDASLKEDLRRELLTRKGQQKNDLPKMIRELRKKATISIGNPAFEKAYKEFIGAGS